MSQTIYFSLPTADNARLVNLCGAMDCNIRHIARAFDVTIKRRGERFRLEGVGATTAADVIKSLYSRADKGIDVNEIRRHLAESPPVAAEQITVSAVAARPAAVALNHPRTEGQRKLQSKIRRHAVTLCIGPAGSGKTHIAVTTALSLLASGQRLLLSRPVVEAGGERLGYLPGDMEQKTNPYLRPLYDILWAVLERREVERRLAAGEIEIVPLAFMRGLTFNDAILILDEAQNTTPGQMKMLLSRLGNNAKIIVTGDTGQSDLQHGVVSGLSDAFTRLSGISDIAFHTLDQEDIVRHPLVCDILSAYEKV
jgi:phosphate starvation-inducible PhoH-like protein